MKGLTRTQTLMVGESWLPMERSENNSKLLQLCGLQEIRLEMKAWKLSG